MNCKVCGKSESEYCFIHKPKKAIPKTKKILKGYKETKTDEMKFFLSIWKRNLISQGFWKVLEMNHVQHSFITFAKVNILI